MGRGSGASQASFSTILGARRGLGSRPGPKLPAGATILVQSLTSRLAQVQKFTGTKRPDIGLAPPKFQVGRAQELLPDVPFPDYAQSQPAVKLSMACLKESDHYLLQDMLAALRLDPYPLPERINLQTSYEDGHLWLSTVALVPTRSRICAQALAQWKSTV